MNIRTATRAAVTATALIAMSFGVTACGGGASGAASRDTQIYVNQDDAREVLVTKDNALSMAMTNSAPDACQRYSTVLADAEDGQFDPKNEQTRDATGNTVITHLYIGTMNEDRTTVLWSPESKDDGESVAVQVDAPLENMLTLDGDTFVPLDSDQGRAAVSEFNQEYDCA